MTRANILFALLILTAIAILLTLGPHCSNDCPNPEPPWRWSAHP